MIAQVFVGHRRARVAWGIMGFLLAVGCDRLPFGQSDQPKTETSSPTRSASSLPAAPPTPKASTATPRPQVDESEVLAWVGDTPILITEYETAVTDELNRRWLTAKLADSKEPLSPMRQQELLTQFTTTERQALRKKLTSEDKQRLLQGLVRKQLWIQDAEARGLEHNADVRKALEASRRELLFYEAIREAIQEVPAPKSEEVEQFYKERQALYKEPDTVQLRVLVVQTEEQAKSLVARLYQGEDFATLASEVSLHESKTRGGLYGWVMQEFYYTNVAKPQGTVGDAVVVFPVLEQLLFSAKLKPNSITTPVPGPDGRWWIARVEAWREGRQKTFIEVEPSIREWLTLQHKNARLEQRIAELEQTARKGGRLKLFEEKLESL